MKPRVYLDTNVFIAAFERTGARSDHAWWLLEAVEEKRIDAATSELTLAETLVRPIAEGDRDLVSTYCSVLQSTDGFDVSAMNRDILISAAHLRAGRRSIRLPDAIHLATAQATGCGAIVSQDQRLEHPSAPPRLPLGPTLVDQLIGGAEPT